MTPAEKQVFDAMRKALDEAKSRLSLLVEREQHKLLDVVARDKAEQALEASEAVELQAQELDAAGVPKLELTVLERHALATLNSIAALPDEALAQIPVSLRMNIDAALMMASMRRVGVR